MLSKERLKKHILNIPGWRTNRKIVVFESDDWGSIRMSSKENVEKLRTSGLSIDNCAYMANDALASNEDLDLLFNLLNEKSKNGKKPVITANFLTANPDFEKIRDSNFQEYFHESCVETLKKYSSHNMVHSYWLQGKENGFLQPQLHGREHLNISRWMRDLQDHNKETHFAFDLNIFGISGTVSKDRRGSYLAAFDGGTKELIFDRTEVIHNAVDDFKKLFGFKPLTFIAPNYTWDDQIEEALAENGVKYIQGTNTQIISRNYGETLKVKRHFLGQKNQFQQKYLIRNAYFEPSSNPNKDWVNSCLKEISTAFTWNKPAIISMHRLNFVGFINEGNRDNTLRIFSQLIDAINKKWPEVEYLASDELARIMK